LLAVQSAVLHFRHLLEGRQFTVFSYHKPLTGALSRVSEPHSDRQRRQLSFIAEFVSEIKHIAGRTNIVADTLSRPPVEPQVAAAVAQAAPTCSPPINIAAAQPSCPDCQRAPSSAALRVITVSMDGHQLMVAPSSSVMRPLVPAALCRRIFDSVHSLAHPGIRAAIYGQNWPRTSLPGAGTVKRAKRSRSRGNTRRP
jgi:cleavage and polyadenylation specificity factor subunit 1